MANGECDLKRRTAAAKKSQTEMKWSVNGEIFLFTDRLVRRSVSFDWNTNRWRRHLHRGFRVP